MGQFRWTDRKKGIERVAVYVSRGFTLEESIDGMLAENRYAVGEGMSELQRKRLGNDAQALVEEWQVERKQEQKRETYIPAWIRLRR
ncbi:hypothetical protein [Desmospora profundinema]|uniref:Uncharacterized protein n=1 Tax=Desmospora profundinema TaxID=1571184 RepID=A0ABU1IQ08_9BACL|nr:hypothetical protein [Desmospora profundinema]MDR6226879.1 hypothetical protein [Desmospora profundinema]